MDNTHHTVTASRNVGSTLRLLYGHSIDCQYDHRYRPYRRVPARDDDTYEQGITVSDTKMATGTTTSHCVQTDDAIADRGEDARAHDQTDPTRLNTQSLNGLLGRFRHCIQCRADGPGQIASIIRFVEQVLSVRFRHAGIAGGEQNPQTRAQAPRRGG